VRLRGHRSPLRLPVRLRGRRSPPRPPPVRLRGRHHFRGGGKRDADDRGLNRDGAGEPLHPLAEVRNGPEAGGGRR
jgi:hypothetical protein